MLVENYEQQRKVKDFWAIILFTISTTSALFLSYIGGYNGKIIEFFKVLKLRLFSDSMSLLCSFRLWPFCPLLVTDFVNPQLFCHPLIFELAMLPPDTMPRKRVHSIFFFRFHCIIGSE